MTLDLKAATFLGGLRPFPVAVTTLYDGRPNGLMSLSAGAASIVPESPRATVSITKYNHSHDLISESGIFTIHLLSCEADQLDASLEILMALGGSSGRDGDKLANLNTQPGVTGAPILQDALVYVECRVAHSLDCDEQTTFVGDVVAAEQLRKGDRLDIGQAWSKLPREWLKAYDLNHEPQVESAREYRQRAAAAKA
jgi:flavin reductase (DIM6/NTAB) family NADH-FMN oxidoreductase RutF